MRCSIEDSSCSSLNDNLGGRFWPTLALGAAAEGADEGVTSEGVDPGEGRKLSETFASVQHNKHQDWISQNADAYT